MNHETGPSSAFGPLAKARPRFTITIGKMMGIILVAGCLFAWLSVVVRQREGNGPRARRAACMNNLKQIALALENYQAAYAVFPPAFIADENGKPMHSWRVLILPFLEQQALYDQYDFGEPWDGPNNIKLLGKMPPFFRCPSSSPGPAASTATSFVVITGPGTMFPGAESIRRASLSTSLPTTPPIQSWWLKWQTCGSPGPNPRIWIYAR